MINPRISIIIPMFNGEKHIQEALESIVAQTFTDWEAIVVDDCSEDSGPDIVSLFAAREPRVRLLRNQMNSGAAVSRNKGITVAKGHYIAFLDCDDIWLPDKLSRQAGLMDREGFALSYSAYRLVKSDGSEYGIEHRVPPSITYRDLLKRNVIGCSTAMVEASLMKRHLMSTTCYHEDYATWLQLLAECRVAGGLTEILTLYRYYPGSKSNNKLRSAQKTYEIYRRCCKMSAWQAAWHMLIYLFYGLRKYAGL